MDHFSGNGVVHAEPNVLRDEIHSAINVFTKWVVKCVQISGLLSIPPCPQETTFMLSSMAAVEQQDCMGERAGQGYDLTCRVGAGQWHTAGPKSYFSGGA